MIGGTLGGLWAASGHRVMLSSRNPEKLAKLSEKIGGNASYGTVEEAAGHGEVVLLAIPMWGVVQIGSVLKEAARSKVLVDAMNFFESRDAPIAERLRRFGGAHSAFIASLFPGSRLVKAFNTIYYKTLRTQSNREGNRMAVPFAADDEGAKGVARNLITDAGFEPCDAGTLRDSYVMQPENLLWTRELTLAEMRKLLDSR